MIFLCKPPFRGDFPACHVADYQGGGSRFQGDSTQDLFGRFDGENQAFHGEISREYIDLWMSLVFGWSKVDPHSVNSTKHLLEHFMGKSSPDHFLEYVSG